MRLTLLSLALSLAIVSGLSVSGRAQTTAMDSLPVPVAEDIRVQLTPQDEARILSRMTGVVAEVPLRDGDRVKAGDIIVAFICDERDQLAAQALARKNKQDRLAASSARQLELGTGSKIDSAVRAAEKAEADSSYDLAKTESEYCRVRAPFDGRISFLGAKPYQTVRENDLIVEVIQDDTLEAEMIVPSQWLAWLKPGLVFDIVVDETAGRYPARITHIGGRVDPVSQSVKVYAELEKRPPELLVGMSGTAALVPPPASPTSSQVTP